MSEKLEILQCLIENRIFTSSPSTLAQELGYKGKMTFYRIIKGKVTENTVNDVWKKLKVAYYLEDDDLYRIANICYTAKDFYDRIVPEMNIWHPLWVENVIISLVEDQYDYCSETFKKEVLPELMEMKREEPNIFWGMAVLFYIRARKIEPYSKDTYMIRYNLLLDLDKILFSLHPENINAHQAVDNLITIMKLYNNTINIWTLLYNSIILFRYYTDTDFIRKAAQCSVIFDWPSRSYWIVPDTTYQKGAEVWLLVQNSFNTANNGIYIAIKLKAGKNIEEFIPQSTYIIQFLFPENILLVTRMNNGHKEICFYEYEYNANLKTLNLRPISDIDSCWNKLPDILYRIDSSSLNSMSEKVWWRILEKFDKGGTGQWTYKKAIEKFTGVSDLSNNYEIRDINISRTMLSMILIVSNKEQQYQIPITNYSFLSKINPSESVIITRHKSDNEIYVEWPNLGYAIKLSEWEKL